MYAIAQTFGQYPALNIVSGWLAWEAFCWCVCEKRCVAVVSVNDDTMRVDFSELEGIKFS